MDMPPVNDPVVVNLAVGAADAPGSTHFFKLPDFWPASPHAWFGVVEAQFAIRNITRERDRFGLVTAVLPSLLDVNGG